MVSTKSEILFAKYCKYLGIESKRVAEKHEQRPDYCLIKNNSTCIAEVKEFVANNDEKESINSFNNTGVGTAYGGKPGERVRNKIHSAVPQLKQLTKEQYPGILVLYYNVPELPGDGCADSYHILTAMYGLQTVTITQSHEDFIPDKFGPGRQTSATCNTTLSAILVIRDFPGTISSSLYHNFYAAIPLPYDFFSHNTCDQFSLENGSSNIFKQFSLLEDA